MVLLVLFQVYLIFAVIFTLLPFLLLLRKEQQEDKLISNGTLPSSIAVIIPAFRAGNFLLDNIDMLLSLKGARKENIIVVCDHCQSHIISSVKSRGVVLVERNFTKSTKVKALQAASQVVPWYAHDIVVLDADNIVDRYFFDEISLKCSEGYEVVQGKRVAKNEDTGFASLDALSEHYNNLLFRELRTKIGLSSSIIGSGFLISRTLFENTISDLYAVGGFDKELEILLMLQGIKIGYAKRAIVQDEKIRTAEAFENQRRRWISAQFVYFRKQGFHILSGWLRSGNMDLLDKFLQLFFPPRTILLLGLILLLILSFVLPDLFFHKSVWTALIISMGFSLIATVIREKHTLNVVQAFTELPSWCFHMLKALTRVPGANRSFIHTKHQ